MVSFYGLLAILLVAWGANAYVTFNNSNDFYEHAHRVSSSGEETGTPFRHRAYSEGYLGGFW